MVARLTRQLPSLAAARSLALSTMVAGGGSALSMGFAAIGGLLLVRFLDPVNYALYAIALGLLQTVQMLGDSGTASAALNEARTDWRSDSHVATMVAAGRRVRRPIQVAVYIVAFLAVICLFFRHQASLLTGSAAGLMVIAAAWLANEGNLFNIPLYLHQKIASLQIAQVTADLVRLFLVISVVYLYRNSLAAIAVMLLGFLVKTLILKKKSQSLLGDVVQVDPERVIKIKNFVKDIRPVWIYACFSGSITIFLAALFGATMDVAAVGGLGRLGALMAIGGFVFGSIVAPRFSRELDPTRLKKKLWLSLLALVGINVATLAPFILFPQLGLLLLGDNYSGFSSELQLSCIGSATASIYGGIYALALGRGFLVKPWIYLGIVLSWQVVLFAIFDLSSLRGILWIGILTPIPGILAYAISLVRGVSAEVHRGTELSA